MVVEKTDTTETPHKPTLEELLDLFRPNESGRLHGEDKPTTRTTEENNQRRI